MRTYFKYKALKWLLIGVSIFPLTMFAQTGSSSVSTTQSQTGIVVLLIIMSLCILVASLFLSFKVKTLIKQIRRNREGNKAKRFMKYLNNLNSKQIKKLLLYKRKQNASNENLDSH